VMRFETGGTTSRGSRARGQSNGLSLMRWTSCLRRQRLLHAPQRGKIRISQRLGRDADRVDEAHTVRVGRRDGGSETKPAEKCLIHLEYLHAIRRALVPLVQQRLERLGNHDAIEGDARAIRL